MERLILLSQDKATLADLKEYFTQTLNHKIVKATLAKQDTSGYADASEIIKVALKEIDDLYKPEKKQKNINQSE